MTMRKPTLLLAVAVSGTLAACGDDGPVTNLKAVFFRTVPTAPVATFTLQRQNGAPIEGLTLVFDTRTVFDGQKVGPAQVATTGTNGVASIALAAGTYPMHIGWNPSVYGHLNDTLAVSQDVSRTYRTSQQTWTVTSPKAFSSLSITVYQVDAGGKVLFDNQVSMWDWNPLLSFSPPVPGGNATQVTFSTELFKGSYRARIEATPAVAGETIAPLVTGVFAAAGGGAIEPQSAALSSGGNIVSLRFMDAGAPVPDAAIGIVAAYDAASLVYLDSVHPTNGVATLSTGAVSNVVAIVLSPDNQTLAAGAFTASPSHSATLTRYTVSGHAKPSSGAALTPDGNNSYGQVAATLKTSLGSYWDDSIAMSSVETDITDALGTYQLKLFAGSWSLQAVALKNLPSSAAVNVNLVSDLPAQEIAIDPGGVIAGNIQDEARNNLSAVAVIVYDSSHRMIAGALTDASGNYSLPVPFGSWSVLAGGALTKDVSVSSGTVTRTLNLTRFQVTGRLTDKASAPVAGHVYWGGGNADATNLGTYSINVMQGLNWFLFVPPSTAPSLALTYATDVLVNADTVKSLK